MQESSNAKSRARRVAEAMLMVATVMGALFAFNNWRARQCHENVRMLDKACIAYSNDHSEMPATLDLLVPKTISAIPNCPSTGGNYVVAPWDRGWVACTHQNWHDWWLPLPLYHKIMG